MSDPHEGLRQAIEEEIGKCEENVGRLKEASKPVAPDNAIGRLTRMEAINSKHMAEANLASTKQRLQALKSTLQRLDNDPDFGLCIVCGEEIPEKRLLVRPESTKCVRCAS